MQPHARFVLLDCCDCCDCCDAVIAVTDKDKETQRNEMTTKWFVLSEGWNGTFGEIAVDRHRVTNHESFLPLMHLETRKCTSSRNRVRYSGLRSPEYLYRYDMDLDKYIRVPIVYVIHTETT